MDEDRSWVGLPWSDPRARAGAKRRLHACQLEAAILLEQQGIITPAELQATAATLIARPDVPDLVKEKALPLVAAPPPAE